MSAASIAAEVGGVGGQPVWSAWLLSQKEVSSKDDAQESPQTAC